MAFERFKSRITELIVASNKEIEDESQFITVSFSIDDGKFIADCSDGTKIVGNAISPKLTVMFGSGHQAMA